MSTREDNVSKIGGDRIFNRKQGKRLLGGLVATIVLILLSLSCNIFHITSKLAGAFFPEYAITNDMIKEGAVTLIDWELQPTGEILSVSHDPMIAIYYKSCGISKHRLYCLDVILRNETEGHMQVWYLPNYQLQSGTYENGKTHIVLEKKRLADIGIRLDLFDEINKSVYVESIIFNDNAAVTVRFQNIFLAFLVIWICLLAVYLLEVYCLKRKIVFDRKMVVSLVLWGSFAVWVCCFFYVDFFLGIDSINLSYILLLLLMAVCAVEQDFGVLIPVGLMQGMHLYSLYAMGEETFCPTFFHYANSSLTHLNMLFGLWALLCLQVAFGRHFGSLVGIIITWLYVIANLVKLHFQNNVLCIADLGLGKEIVGIAGEIIPVKGIILIIFLLVLSAALIIWQRKKFRDYFRIRIGWGMLPAIAATVLFLFMISGNRLNAIGIGIMPNAIAYESIYNYGFTVYTMIEFSGQNAAEAPEGYPAELASVVAQTKAISAETDVKPTVILILAESIFEVEEIPDLTFNEGILSDLAPYKIANNVSPSYGGRTAGAEWESLTGLSSLFLPGDTMAYTAYLKTDHRFTGSLAREFAESGYHTVAVHANREDYYGRNVVYQNMGFDDFISKEDFAYTEEDIVGGSFVVDDVFVDTIIDLEEQTTDPLFVFGATIESHAEYLNKYNDMFVEAYSDAYSELALKEAAAYAQAAYHTDKALSRLIDYYEQSGQPVLIYIYGDHLPALTINSEDGYLENKYLQYSTPLYAYSNYTDVSVDEEYLSTSYIATEILRNSGITYDAYFNTIYQIRQTYPITHKAFVSDVTSADLQLYNQITWDLTQGERYLLK